MSQIAAEDWLLKLYHRAEIAKVSLEDPGIVDAIETLRVKAFQQIRLSDPEATAIREHAYCFLRALDGVEQELGRRIRQYEETKRKKDRDEDPKKVDRTIKV